MRLRARWLTYSGEGATTYRVQLRNPRPVSYHLSADLLECEAERRCVATRAIGEDGAWQYGVHLREGEAMQVQQRLEHT